jgi:hypothetical protein
LNRREIAMFAWIGRGVATAPATTLLGDLSGRPKFAGKAILAGIASPICCSADRANGWVSLDSRKRQRRRRLHCAMAATLELPRRHLARLHAEPLAA